MFKSFRRASLVFVVVAALAAATAVLHAEEYFSYGVDFYTFSHCVGVQTQQFTAHAYVSDPGEMSVYMSSPSTGSVLVGYVSGTDFLDLGPFSAPMGQSAAFTACMRITQPASWGTYWDYTVTWN